MKVSIKQNYSCWLFLKLMLITVLIISCKIKKTEVSGNNSPAPVQNTPSFALPSEEEELNINSNVQNIERCDDEVLMDSIKINSKDTLPPK